MKKNQALRLWVISVFIIFVTLSFIFGYSPGKKMGQNFLLFALSMLKLLPCAFVLIGLFEVWTRKAFIEKHLGTDSGLRGYMWAVLLAGTTVGGLYVSFPVAYALHLKGAKPGVIFAYVGASAICRVPMAIFEASFLGLKFTAIRIFVSIPLVVFASELLGRYMESSGYRMMKKETP